MRRAERGQPRGIVARVLLVGLLLFVGPMIAGQGCRSDVGVVDPPMAASRDGQLTVRLTAAPGHYQINGTRLEGMLYNGAYVPSLLRVRPGETLTVQLENRLPEMTNLHFHGLHVSPLGHGDNIFVHIHSGQSFTYRVEVPAEHSPGLYWYHSHTQGRASPQIIAGLSGGLIVEGSDRLYPFLKDLRERVLLLKHAPDPRREGEEIVTVNGQLAPAIPIRPGEAQYWRIGNVGADVFLRLRLEGLAFFLVATDGHYLSRPIRTEELPLGPGSRVEGVVVGGPLGRLRPEVRVVPARRGTATGPRVSPGHRDLRRSRRRRRRRRDRGTHRADRRARRGGPRPRCPRS